MAAAAASRQPLEHDFRTKIAVNFTRFSHKKRVKFMRFEKYPTAAAVQAPVNQSIMLLV